MQTHITFERHDPIGYLVFACDEPGKPNTLDHQVLDELDGHLAAIEGMSDLRAVVLRSDAPKYFVVGANINALQELSPETIVRWVRHGHGVLNRLEALPIPAVARVEGFCLGGGLELAMACDLILAAETARFGQPEANLGLVAGWGGSYRLPRRIGLARAKELFYTARVIDAATADRFGLAENVGPAEAMDARLDEILQGIGTCGAVAVSQMKSLLNGSLEMSLADNGQREAEASRLALSSEETQEREATFLESRRKRRESG
jgi:enoyl-CoA hydratase